MKARRLAEANASASEETEKVSTSQEGESETRKRSRSMSTSSLIHEKDLKPTKQLRGKSSSRIKATDTPVFLQDPDLRDKLPEAAVSDKASENEQNDV